MHHLGIARRFHHEPWASQRQLKNARTYRRRLRPGRATISPRNPGHVPAHSGNGYESDRIQAKRGLFDL